MQMAVIVTFETHPRPDLETIRAAVETALAVTITVKGHALFLPSGEFVALTLESAKPRVIVEVDVRPTHAQWATVEAFIGLGGCASRSPPGLL